MSSAERLATLWVSWNNQNMKPRVDAVDRLDETLGWLRRCHKCRQEKPHEAFGKHHRDHKGLQRACKECSSARKQGHHPKPSAEDYKARYAKHKDVVTFSSRAHYRTVRGRFLTLISAARFRANKKGIEHDLDIEWALEQWETQRGRCLITGIELILDTPLRTDSKDLNPFAPSLDRINCSGGYTKENTRIVCVAVNIALNRFGLEVFRTVVEGFNRTQN